jgi:hypothetical protein
MRPLGKGGGSAKRASPSPSPSPDRKPPKFTKKNGRELNTFRRASQWQKNPQSQELWKREALGPETMHVVCGRAALF